jgi:hypothetical protein
MIVHLGCDASKTAIVGVLVTGSLYGSVDSMGERCHAEDWPRLGKSRTNGECSSDGGVREGRFTKPACSETKLICSSLRFVSFESTPLAFWADTTPLPSKHGTSAP